MLIAVLATGCSASSDFMYRPATPVAPRPSPDAALVVFIQPSAFASAQRITILDARGRFLGDSLPESYFAVQVPPGDHVFIGWAENTAALRARVAPGRTYYVEVSPRIGMLSARVQLLAITPRSESWAEVSDWLRDADLYLVDEPAGQAYLRERSEDAYERIRRGHEILGEYDAEELEERTLRAEDGT